MIKRENEHSSHFVRRGCEEKRREEKKEGNYEEVHSRNVVTSFIEYNKDKVLVDVATSLAVNHINLGALCLFMLCLCLCLC